MNDQFCRECGRPTKCAVDICRACETEALMVRKFGLKIKGLGGHDINPTPSDYEIFFQASNWYAVARVVDYFELQMALTDARICPLSPTECEKWHKKDDHREREPASPEREPLVAAQNQDLLVPSEAELREVSSQLSHLISNGGSQRLK